jgi:hypothetical protein
MTSPTESDGIAEGISTPETSPSSGDSATKRRSGKKFVLVSSLQQYTLPRRMPDSPPGMNQREERQCGRQAPMRRVELAITRFLRENKELSNTSTLTDVSLDSTRAATLSGFRSCDDIERRFDVERSMRSEMSRRIARWQSGQAPGRHKSPIVSSGEDLGVAAAVTLNSSAPRC